MLSIDVRTKPRAVTCAVERDIFVYQSTVVLLRTERQRTVSIILLFGSFIVECDYGQK